MNYNTCTLPNGLRVIHLPSASPVVYCGIAVKGGTRHEQPGEEGIAHFCEHLTFKGTARRTSVQIINALEGVGGELNAFTNKEDTVYYCAILRDHFRRAVDVLCDIVFCSQYPQHEVEKEREVVCDEIESYEDTPAELIFDDIENLLFEGHPLGHNILGTAAQVRGYNSEDALRFVRRYYRPDNCIFFANGDIDFKRLVKMLGGIEVGGERLEQHNYSLTSHPSYPTLPRELIRHRNTHQAHVIVGTRAYSANDTRRWALYLLNNILGGPGMNSRLNLSLRERNGLVYTVESSMVCYQDTGLWTVYFGCDPADVARCRRLVRRELNRLMQQPLSPAQLRTAKRQLQGQLAIATDNREQFAIDFAKNFLHTGKTRDLTNVMAHIDALTPDDLQQTAVELFADDRMTTLIYQ
jgi:predicted Zn-dependent peptidase